MRYWWILTIVAVLAVGSVLRLGFDPAEGPFEAKPDANEALDEALGSQLLMQGVPGASVAVIRDGQIAERWTGGVGHAWRRAPITETTVFEGASLSKPVTAYAVMRLVDEGQLDLDAVVTLNGFDFTIRQVLSHTAGFDNSLSSPYQPTQHPGSFIYAGSGYLWLGEQIERVTGQSFQTHMNTVILPELGMGLSHYGRADSDETNLAKPHMSVLLPFLFVALGAVIVGVPLLMLHAGIRMLLGRRHQKPNLWIPRVIFATAIMAGLYLPLMIMGSANYTVMLTTNLVLLGAIAVLVSAFRSNANTTIKIASVFAGALIVASIALRPPLPLEERQASFLPAAGLRTTASDYARFLTHLVRPQHLSADLAEEMMRPVIGISLDNAWGLGLGIQQGEEKIVWQWGVNFPGYQAFAMIWPETGDGVVVLMNGGPANFSPDGMRFTGLELARDALIAVHGGTHSAYWQDAQ